jgi:transcriptional regulator with XRE-family HTH domain
MKINNVIRELRLSRRISKSQLARLAGISKPFVSQLERGNCEPGLRTLERLSDAFGIGLERLLKLDAAELMLQDRFVQDVRPFVPRLNQVQRLLVLRTLQAAPQQRRRE